MAYLLNEIPFVSKLYSYTNSEGSNIVICSSSGKIKIIECDPAILEEVLYYVDGINDFGFIEGKFDKKYSKSEISNFLNILLEENIIEKISNNIKNIKEPKILVIGEGLIGKGFEGYDFISIDDFLKKYKICNFDMAIFSPSSCTYYSALEINKKLYKFDKPFIQISFDGLKISVGPLVIPNKSACLECVISSKLKNINNRISDNKAVSIENLNDINYSFSLINKFKNFQINYIINIIQEDLKRFFNGHLSDFLDYQYLFDTGFLNYEKKEKIPTTYCKFCSAINKNYIRFENGFNIEEYFLNSESRLEENIAKYKIGGIRSKTEKETKAIIENELYKFGINIRIEEAVGNVFNDNGVASCFNAFFDQNNCNEMPYFLRKNEAAGKGITKSQSYFSAVFELFEHMNLEYTGNIPIICAKYEDVKDYAIDMPYLFDTIMNKNTDFDNFCENIEMDWVVATSLINDEKKLVPAFLVFMDDVELKGCLFTSTSSGAASALNLEDAILHGLLEVIERDAWLIGQCNPYILPIVDYNSIEDLRIKEIISKIKSLGYDIINRDYTNDLGVPTFRTWVFNKNNYSDYAYNGLGCHICPKIALERSITEALQTQDNADFGCDVESALINQESLSNNLVNLYNQHFLINKDILGKTDKLSKIGNPIFDFNSSYEAIKKLSELIKNKIGVDSYYVELTKSDSNIKVVRTIIMGDIQQMNEPLISASNRMFDFGIRCGYNDKKTIYEELFMGHYAS